MGCRVLPTALAVEDQNIFRIMWTPFLNLCGSPRLIPFQHFGYVCAKTRVFITMQRKSTPAAFVSPMYQKVAHPGTFLSYSSKVVPFFVSFHLYSLGHYAYVERRTCAPNARSSHASQIEACSPACKGSRRPDFRTVPPTHTSTQFTASQLCLQVLHPKDWHPSVSGVLSAYLCSCVETSIHHVKPDNLSYKIKYVSISNPKGMARKLNEVFDRSDRSEAGVRVMVDVSNDAMNHF